MSTIDEHSPGTIIQTGPVTLPPASTGLQSPDNAVATTAREACTNLTSAPHSQLRAAAPRDQRPPGFHPGSTASHRRTVHVAGRQLPSLTADGATHKR
jgi:hypothetical protein